MDTERCLSRRYDLNEIHQKKNDFKEMNKQMGYYCKKKVDQREEYNLKVKQQLKCELKNATFEIERLNAEISKLKTDIAELRKSQDRNGVQSKGEGKKKLVNSLYYYRSKSKKLKGTTSRKGGHHKLG